MKFEQKTMEEQIRLFNEAVIQFRDALVKSIMPVVEAMEEVRKSLARIKKDGET